MYTESWLRSFLEVIDDLEVKNTTGLTSDELFIAKLKDVSIQRIFFGLKNKTVSNLRLFVFYTVVELWQFICARCEI